MAKADTDQRDPALGFGDQVEAATGVARVARAGGQEEDEVLAPRPLHRRCCRGGVAHDLHMRPEPRAGIGEVEGEAVAIVDEQDVHAACPIGAAARIAARIALAFWRVSAASAAGSLS